MLSRANILFIKDVVQISAEQLGGVISLLNSLFNRCFPGKKELLWLFFNLFTHSHPLQG